jgi:topoisomerase IA-like protein
MGTQFLTDEKGKRTAVVMPIEKYNKLIEQLEDLHDIKLYDEAQKDDDGFRISIDEAFKIIEEKRKAVK